LPRTRLDHTQTEEEVFVLCAKQQNESGATPLFNLQGVGKQIAKHLARLKIYSVQDLLFHLPLRYQDRTQIALIHELIPGHEAVIEGVIKSALALQRGRTKLLCELADDTGVIHLRFFHVLPFQLDRLKIGVRVRCYSVVRSGPKGLEMTHPEFQVIAEGRQIPVDQYLTPIYAATEGLSQYMLRKLTLHALDWMENENVLCELLPASLLQSLAFPTLQEALRFVHRPPHAVCVPSLLENKTIPQVRLVFEELLAHRISMLCAKQAFQSQKGVPLIQHENLLQRFRKHLPFQLTQAQERVTQEINEDLTRPYPMLRLVQGDVGSGKTVIAALAMLQVIENGYQAAMMAPTELLAEQHYRGFKHWFEPLGIRVVFLSGRVKARVRTVVMQEIENGSAQIILGTHALFQESVSFLRLALVIVDEQHRFGVHQRALFRGKGMHAQYCPHQLVMTATPIPRTLAMSFYADLDCSTIDELPPGRTPIMTSVMADSRRHEVIARIREACQQGRQAYWVCPLIDESEVIASHAATKTAEELQKKLPELKIGLIHGRMSSDNKEKVMYAFQQGETHLLVATTVIEVGVDVPSACVMVIENSERLGLSQLHQLRGRVGRGAVASHCVLLYQYPLSELAKERLSVMRKTVDGFKIAQRDLELRGPGEVLGTKQTGELSFRVADLIRDSEMLPHVYKAAELIMREHKDMISPLANRWLRNKNEYGKV